MCGKNARFSCRFLPYANKIIPVQIELIKKRVNDPDEPSTVRMIAAGGLERRDMRPKKTVQFEH